MARKKTHQQAAQAAPQDEKKDEPIKAPKDEPTKDEPQGKTEDETIKGAKKDKPGNSAPAKPKKVKVPAGDDVAAPVEPQSYVKVFKVLGRALADYSHDGNITATRQEAINSGFTPVSDVVFIGKKAEPGEDGLPDRKKTVALTYSVEVVPTTLAGGAVHQ